MNILFLIIGFLIGVVVGFILDAIEVDATYVQAVDDAYNAGYEQGAREEKQKHVKRLKKVTDDGK